MALSTWSGRGFTLTTEGSAVSDFFDDDEVQEVYSPEVERLVKRASGAAEVLVFDHTIRVADDSVRSERKVREPVHVAHNDYTSRSAPQRVRDLLPADRAEELLQHRFAVVQSWRPIAGPVQDRPLAICDAQSIDARDFVLTDLVYSDRVGEVMQLSHNPGHRWFYFPEMGPGRGTDLQDLRFARRRTGALYRPHGVCQSHRAGGRTPAPEHRIPHPRLLRPLRAGRR